MEAGASRIVLVMPEPLQLRDAPTPTTLVMVRFGSTTLEDARLRQNCEVTFTRWGLHGFSVFELPGGHYEHLARLVPSWSTANGSWKQPPPSCSQTASRSYQPGSILIGPSCSPSRPRPNSHASAATSPSRSETPYGPGRGGGSIGS